MFLVWIGLGMLLAKIFEIDPVAGWSWIWVLSPFILAFLWFEAIESALGMDKRKKAKKALSDEARRERIRAQFAKPQAKR